MKDRIVTLLILVTIVFGFRPALAQSTNTAAAELNALVTKVNDKLREGKKSEAELAPEITEFDQLIEKHKAEKTDDTGEILLMKAMLYLQVLDKPDEGIAVIERIKQDYPETKAGKYSDSILDNVKRIETAKKIQRTLVEGKQFPELEEKDLDGKALTVANFKGKVVLVDFWATWCPACVMELPNLLKVYEKQHDKGFEILGISLDQDEDRLKNFIKQRNMGWPQYFDGKGWENKLVLKYGVQALPASFLLDGEGKIIARNLRGPELEQAVGKALAKN